MVVEKLFVKDGIREAEVEEFLRKMFEKAGYSHTEISRTPMGTRIIVFANKPELVVGRSGRRVNEITNAIKDKFGFENPLIDVKEIDNPFLDSNIVARRIAKAIERGINYKKVANYYLQKVMESGAVGIQIILAGKLAARSRTQKFKEGFVAHSGDYAEKLVDKGYTQAILKLGIIGIKVNIMKEMPREIEERIVAEEKS